MAILERSIEKLLKQQLSIELDRQGITEAGVPVSAAELESSGMSGMGSIIPSYWARAFKSRQVAKARVLKEVAAKATAKAKWLSRDIGTPGTITKVKEQQAIAAEANKQAAAPKLTKGEVIKSMEPTLRKAAHAIAEGVRSQTRKVKKREQLWRGAALSRQPSNVRPVGRQVRTDTFYDYPETVWEGEGFRGDVDRGAEAFGSDIETGAQAFGLDIDTGAQAFGSDVETGAQAFGQAGAEREPWIDGF